MFLNIKMLTGSLAMAILVCLSISCQKMERPELILIPDDTAKLNGPLQRFFAFESSPIDSIYYDKGTESNVTYVDGVSGKAYKGAQNAMIVYPSAGVKVSDMKSFTVAFWMNTQKHGGGAQVVFMLPRTDDFWGNMFVLIEGNTSTTDNTMLLKFKFADNWLEFAGGNNPARLPDMYGKWKHVAFRYDQSTSKIAAFIDGVKQTLPAAVENRTKNGQPLGPLQFTNPSKFIIGGFQQHAGIPAGSNADSWMLKYTGMLDQFRIYTTPLSDTEIMTLFANKR